MGWIVQEAECIETAKIVAYHCAMHGQYDTEVYKEYKDLPLANRKYVIDQLRREGFLVTVDEKSDSLEFNWRCRGKRFSTRCHDTAYEANKMKDAFDAIITDVRRMEARGEKYTTIHTGSLRDEDSYVTAIRLYILDYLLAEEGYNRQIFMNGQCFVTFDKIED